MLALICVVILTAALAVANQDKGAENIELYGGKTGKVPFPHYLHQEVLGGCKICHDIFPQELGAIESLKSQEKLKKKQVMNTHCVKCHKVRKKAGEKSGPIRCRECHKK
jgi:hypothetical protein